MFVFKVKNLFRHLEKLGSLCKASVVRPKGIMPDLALEAPTCVNRDSSFFSSRQGGFFLYYLYLVIAGKDNLQQVRFTGMDNYKKIAMIMRPHKNTRTFHDVSDVGNDRAVVTNGVRLKKSANFRSILSIP